MTKRFLAFLLTLCLALTMLPAAFAEAVDAQPVESQIEAAVGELEALELDDLEEYTVAEDAEAPVEAVFELDSQDAQESDGVKPTKISFNAAKLNIGLNETSTALKVVFDDDPEAVRDAVLTFTSDKPKYVTVDESGALYGVKKGTATITVTTDNGLKATSKVTVKAAPTKVTVKPTAVKLNAGATEALTYKFNSTSAAGAIRWYSDDETIASVDPLTGVVTAVAPGVTKVTCESFNGKQGTAAVTVLDEPRTLDFDAPTLALGATQKYTLEAKLNPGAECPITYTTDNAKVVSLKNNVATAVAAGTATITASTYNGLTATCVITVEPAPKSVSLPIKTLYLGEGQTYQLYPVVDGCATGLTYTTSQKKYVTVTDDGLVKAEKAGTAYITLKTYNKKSFKLKVIAQKAPTSVAVSPKALDLGAGETGKFTVKVPSGTCARVTTEVSDPTVVEVDDETGAVTGLKAGTATIKVTTYNGLTDTCEVTVYPAPDAVVVPVTLDLAVKETAQLAPTIQNGARTAFTYISADTKIATVTAAGLVTGKKAGSITVRVKTYLPDVYADVTVNVWGAPTKVTVSPNKASFGVGEFYQMNPTIPDNTKTTYTYKSANPAVASVDENGLVKGEGKGTTTITVTTHNKKTAKLSVTVLDPYYPESMSLVGTVPKLEIGETFQIVYALTPTSAETGMTWVSSNPAVATVDDNGLINAVGKGTATITVTSTKNAKCKLAVKVKVTPVGGESYAYEGELITLIPERITDIDEIDENLEKIIAIRDCALAQIDELEDDRVISSSDASKRASMVTNIFKNYAFPWMTLKYQDYWKAANSEGGVKDFKPGNVYYGLPYISGSGSNRHYNVAQAVSENRYYDSGNGYYILNQSNLLSKKYVGNDCSGLVDVSIWGLSSSHSDDRTDDIASSSAYKTIKDFKAMRPGDLICKGGSHVVMFLYYVNDAKTEFMMIENGGAEPGTNTVHCDIYPASYYSSRNYKVRRLASLG